MSDLPQETESPGSRPLTLEDKVAGLRRAVGVLTFAVIVLTVAMTVGFVATSPDIPVMPLVLGLYASYGVMAVGGRRRLVGDQLGPPHAICLQWRRRNSDRPGAVIPTMPTLPFRLTVRRCATIAVGAIKIGEAVTELAQIGAQAQRHAERGQGRHGGARHDQCRRGDGGGFSHSFFQAFGLSD